MSRSNIRLLAIAVPVSLFAGCLGGLGIAVALQPSGPDPAKMTNLGRRVVADLGAHADADWHPTGQLMDGLARTDPERVSVIALSVRPDYERQGRVRIVVRGLDVSDQFTDADHAAILEALARRRTAWAETHLP